MSDGQLTGEVIDGRYAVGGLYGTGGMAEVYQAFDTVLERKVAIKLFRGAATREDRIRLAREADVLAALRCPGMIAVYGSGSFRGHPFFVMQAVEGGTLRRRMRGPLAPESVARIGSQVAAVLAHVHRHEVVHRDVKPSNILLDRDERRAYLTDFGLALQAEVTRITRSGLVVGTAAYLAPEQVRGDEITPAVDVFALGLVLLECLTGRPEYPGGDAESALARLHRGPLIPDELPRPWREVLTAMTGLSPRRRPTAAECAELLVAAGRLHLDDAPPPSLDTATAPKPAEAPVVTRRVRDDLLLGGAAAVVIAGTVLLSALDGPEAPIAGDNDQPVIGTSAEPTPPIPATGPPQLSSTSATVARATQEPTAVAVISTRPAVRTTQQQSSTRTTLPPPSTSQVVQRTGAGTPPGTVPPVSTEPQVGEGEEREGEGRENGDGD
ncbi:MULTISPECIES: serine/threonine-protein kinase [Saccharothrix]|uniref:serine/threonine-protein kinase n=1 Tax=Saccharothrix TaxID=2071 RepID=UPI000AAEBBDD|nr:serine/threonine-protein kinase [Saccharothrix sp. CB00851]